jgi:multidrug efflux system membrane fusion protein
VTVSRPVVRAVADWGEYTGHLDAVQRVEVRPQVKGRLVKVHFREGTEIEQGTPLYDIDPEEYRVARDEAKAALGKAVADQTRASAELERAQATLTRYDKLAGTGVSREEYDQAVAAHKTARAAVGQADAALAQARAALESAELNLRYTKIVAPISGRVSRTLVTEGNLVGYGEPTMLTVMVDQDPIYVFFEIPERDAIEYEARVKPLRALAPGLQALGIPVPPLWSDAAIPVEVGVETESGYPHKGVINFRDPRFEPGTGTVRLRAVLGNADRRLSSGMYARVRFPLTHPRERPMVPGSAVQSDQGGRYVLVVGADNTVERRSVRLGQRLGKQVAVEEGLSADDRVVINGIQKARPRSTVAPDEQPMPAE